MLMSLGLGNPFVCVCVCLCEATTLSGCISVTRPRGFGAVNSVSPWRLACMCTRVYVCVCVHSPEWFLLFAKCPNTHSGMCEGKDSKVASQRVLTTSHLLALLIIAIM